MLRAIQPFADHQVGDTITDADEIKAILASEHAAFVVAVADKPDSAPAATSKE